MKKTKNTKKLTKQELIEKISKRLTKCLGCIVLLEFGLFSILMILASLGVSDIIINLFDIPFRIIVWLLLITWGVYLIVTPFIIMYQICLWFKNVDSNWLPTNLCIFTIVALISAAYIFMYIEDEKCMERCLATGTAEDICLFSICD